MPKTKIELDRLRTEIRHMSVRSSLYKLLKEELSARGWWKNRDRGTSNIENIKKKGA